MADVTNAQLAAQLAEFLANSDPRERELRDWQSGTATGGVYSDGRYPITNYLGEVYYYKSPARLNSEFNTATSGALSHKLGAQTAQTAAEAALTSTVAAVAEALGYQNQSEIYKDIALAAQTSAANDAANVSTWHSVVLAAQADVAAKAAQVTLDANQAAEDAGNSAVARVASEAARDLAQGYAVSINPAQFAVPADIDAAIASLVDSSPATMDTLNELAAALGDDPNFATTVTTSLGNKSDIGHGHVVADVSGLQTALDSKSAIGHTHTIANVTGLQTALDGKQVAGSYQAAGSYAASVHTHIIGDVTGLQGALDGKQVAGSYAAASHVHTIANVTGLQASLDGKQASGSYAAASHTHSYLPLSGGSITGSLGVGAATPSTFFHARYDTGVSTGSGMDVVTIDTPRGYNWTGIHLGGYAGYGASGGYSKIRGGRFSWGRGLELVSQGQSEVDQAVIRLDYDNIRFRSSAGEKMTMLSSGNVGIGTTSPTEKLDVSGNIKATGTVTGSNLSGTNTGDQDLSGYLPLTGGTLSGGLIATSFTTASGTKGRVRLQQGTASNTGYIDLLDASGTRLGYMGYGNASYIELSSVGGRYYRFTDTPRVGATAVALTTDLASYLPLTGGTITGDLNASGNVGIGVTAPASKLEVAGAVRIKSAGGDSNGLNLSSDAGGIGYINAGYATVGQLVFQTQGSERMRINASGHITAGGLGVARHVTAGQTGASMTTSTASPSGGADGDIWFKV